MIDFESRCAHYEHKRFSSIHAGLRDDIQRFATFSDAYQPKLNFKTSVSIFLKPPLLCLFWYRLSHCLHVRGWKWLAHVVYRFNLILHKADISPQSCIGPGCFLGHCPGAIFHGMAGRGLTMLSLAVCCPEATTFGADRTRWPRLGDNVSLGANTVIMGPVTIGDNVRFTPKTCLSGDCPPNSIAFSARLRNKVVPSQLEQQRSVSNASH
jgi:serine O-acetyltransferase